LYRRRIYGGGSDRLGGKKWPRRTLLISIGVEVSESMGNQGRDLPRASFSPLI